MSDPLPSGDLSGRPESGLADGAAMLRPFREIERESAELDAMRRMLAASRGTFSLSIAVCNSPKTRRRLVGALLEADADYIQVAVPPDTGDFLKHARIELGSCTPSALFLVDLEDSIPSDGARPAIRLLNATREKWRQCFACPVVFWLPEYAVKLLTIEARDFWAWRSHQFEFVSGSVEPGAEASHTFGGGLHAALDLDADRKQFRIAELQDRIKATGEVPDKELATHVMTWLNELGILLATVGRATEAERAFEQLAELSKRIGSRENEAAALGNLGVLSDARAELDEAERMFRKALAIYKSLGRVDGIATQHANLGLIHRKRGDLDAAEQMLRKALDMDAKSGQSWSTGSYLTQLGTVLGDRGDLDGAEEMFRQALEIDSKLGRLVGMAQHFDNLGVVFRRRGDLEQAAQMHRKSTGVNRQLGRPDGTANALNNLGLVYQLRGDSKQAIDAYRQCRDIDGQLRPSARIATVTGNLGLLLFDEGNLEEAEEMFREALKIEQGFGREQGIAEGHLFLGQVLKERGDFKQATPHILAARDFYAEAGNQSRLKFSQRLLDSLGDAEAD